MFEAIITTTVKNTHAEEPKKFKAEDFKWWQMRILFYLTTLNLAHILREEKLAVPTANATNEQEATLEAWNHSDFLCQNYILNGLEDILYNVYSTFNIAKELWESLEKK